MRRFLITILILITTALFAHPYKLYNNLGEVVSLDDVVDVTSKGNVLFFGEFHDDAIIHQLEIELLEKMHAVNPDILVSMEMFERDTQDVVDQYMAGKIEEDVFITESRAWPNYLTDYKPIVDFAKEKGLPLLASNIPRRYAALINKSGFDSLPEDAKIYVAKEHKVIKDKYYDQFIEIMKRNMKSHGGGKMPMVEESIDPIYEAQCIKDDTMAESITKYLQNNPDKFVIHYNGDFHSRHHLGTAQKLAMMNDKLKISVIASVYGDDLTFLDEYKEFGDFILVIEKEEVKHTH